MTDTARRRQTRARAWLYVIWHCWHNRLAYDPARYRALQHLLATHGTGAEQAA